VKDAESGIKSITASIYDVTLKVTVWSETRPPLQLQSVDSRRKRVSNAVLVAYMCMLSQTIADYYEQLEC